MFPYQKHEKTASGKVLHVLMQIPMNRVAVHIHVYMYIISLIPSYSSYSLVGSGTCTVYAWIHSHYKQLFLHPVYLR